MRLEVAAMLACYRRVAAMRLEVVAMLACYRRVAAMRLGVGVGSVLCYRRVAAMRLEVVAMLRVTDISPRCGLMCWSSSRVSGIRS